MATVIRCDFEPRASVARKLNDEPATIIILPVIRIIGRDDPPGTPRRRRGKRQNGTIKNTPHE